MFFNFVLKFLFLIRIISSGGDYCSINDSEKCVKQLAENNYSSDINSNSFYRRLRKAQEDYTPCESTNCNCFIDTIKQDLQRFAGGITKKHIDAVRSKGVKYQIFKHRLYREPKCMFPARCAGVEHFLKELLPKLPNMEFILNSRDWPQINANFDLVGPVFSFSKTADYSDIMYPAWAFWEGGPAIGLYPRGIGRWDLHRTKIGTVANETDWQAKVDKVFFRGSRTSTERDALVLLSRSKPELVDARYTKNQAWKSAEDTLNVQPAAEVSFADHCKYKYLFNYRGVAASFRLKHIMLCKSLVFHVGNEWLEFFYGQLKPWIHYVPVEADANQQQLLELIQFVRDYDDEARRIAERGSEFIWNHLALRDVRCYWLKLLKRYAKLLRFDVVLDNSLKEI